MLKATQDLILPTAIIGSFPRPSWYTESLNGRSFKKAMGDALFREQYLDTLACVINTQESAGLDIVTDGDTRFDLAVGGKSWHFYPIERIEGVTETRDGSPVFTKTAGTGPGDILWEVAEAYQPGVVTQPLARGPLEYAALWKVAKRFTDKPVKFGAVSAQCIPGMLWNNYYDQFNDLINALVTIMNAEFRELAEAGCEIIQVEEPRIHMATANTKGKNKDVEFYIDAFNREVEGVNAEIWAHTCWGNPNQQRIFWDVPSYEKAIPYMLELNADVITFECASTLGRDLPHFAKYKTDKKIGIGVISHTNTVVEPPSFVAELIRYALKFIPPERLVLTTDCGFGREGLSRRIAYYKCVSLVMGANIVRKELGLPEVRVRAADPTVYFADRDTLLGQDRA